MSFNLKPEKFGLLKQYVEEILFRVDLLKARKYIIFDILDSIVFVIDLMEYFSYVYLVGIVIMIIFIKNVLDYYLFLIHLDILLLEL